MQKFFIENEDAVNSQQKRFKVEETAETMMWLQQRSSCFKASPSVFNLGFLFIEQMIDENKCIHLL